MAIGHGEGAVPGEDGSGLPQDEVRARLCVVSQEAGLCRVSGGDLTLDMFTHSEAKPRAGLRAPSWHWSGATLIPPTSLGFHHNQTSPPCAHCPQLIAAHNLGPHEPQERLWGPACLSSKSTAVGLMSG